MINKVKEKHFLMHEQETMKLLKY